MMEAYTGWAILELMGHRRIGGCVSEVSQYGATMIRIDVHSTDKDAPPIATQFYGGGSIYCLTPTTEDVARAVGDRNRPAPVQVWELPRLPAASDETEKAVAKNAFEADLEAEIKQAREDVAVWPPRRKREDRSHDWCTCDGCGISTDDDDAFAHGWTVSTDRGRLCPKCSLEFTSSPEASAEPVDSDHGCHDCGTECALRTAGVKCDRWTQEIPF